MNDNTLILVNHLSITFSSLSSDVKGLSLAKREAPWNPLNSPGFTSVLYFDQNHNNSVTKKLTNKYTKN